jgi:hypothetical protein
VPAQKESFPVQVLMPQMERRTGAVAMSFIHTTFSIFRGHIPNNTVRTDSSIVVPPIAVMGVLVGAALVVALALWATIWLAIRLI